MYTGLNIAYLFTLTCWQNHTIPRVDVQDIKEALVKKFGIALMIFQGVAIFGLVVAGDYSIFMLDTHSSYAILAGLIKILAFFFVGIIGLIIFLRCLSKEKHKLKDQSID